MSVWERISGKGVKLTGRVGLVPHKQYKGVFLDCQRRDSPRPWRAEFREGKTHIILGRYKTDDAAALAYNNYIINNKIKRKVNEVKA
jgi:hypothetical protein